MKQDEGIQADLNVGGVEYRFFCTEGRYGPEVGVFNLITEQWITKHQRVALEVEGKQKAEGLAKKLWKYAGDPRPFPGLQWTRTDQK
jgi:hypothetical protein